MTLLAWLRLIRLPTVFTAMADIFLGFLMTTGGTFEPLNMFAPLLAASSCLYFAGMIFNDVFDREQDRRERPERPIPSGAISVRAAVAAAVGLCILGVTAAALTGPIAAGIAALLVVAILSYDWLLKQTILAPLAMGSCRFLNVLLGASTADAADITRGPLPVAAALGLYIAGLTLFARREAGDISRRDLIGGTIGMNMGLAGMILVVLLRGKQVGLIAGLILFIAAVINRRLLQAVSSQQGPDIGSGIRTALLSLVMIDATLVLATTGKPEAAVATAALIMPASLLRRWIPLT